VLTIGRLRLRLPSGFAPRAPGIARLLADELAALQPAADQRIERLSLPPVSIDPNATDRDVARAMARAVASAAGLQSGEQP